MKCYMMGPHRVGIARPAYWPHGGPSLDGVRVVAVASGRNHMVCIGVAGGKAAAVYHRTFVGREISERSLDEAYPHVHSS